MESALEICPVRAVGTGRLPYSRRVVAGCRNSCHGLISRRFGRDGPELSTYQAIAADPREPLSSEVYEQRGQGKDDEQGKLSLMACYWTGSYEHRA